MLLFGDLPPELTVYILAFLDYQSLVICRGINHQLRTAIDETVFLQYIILLGILSMENGSSSCKMTVSERFDALRTYQRGWSTAQWHEQQDLTGLEGIFEMTGGLFAQTPILYGGEVEFTQLPSEYRGIEQRQWTVKLPEPIIDLTMDESQDLLVLLKSIPEGR